MEAMLIAGDLELLKLTVPSTTPELETTGRGCAAT